MSKKGKKASKKGVKKAKKVEELDVDITNEEAPVEEDLDREEENEDTEDTEDQE